MTRGESYDISRKATGIVTWRDKDPIGAELLALPEGFIGEQLHAFELHVTRRWEYGQNKPDWVSYENASVRSFNHAQIQLALVGQLLKLCYRHDVSVAGFMPSTLKKALAGHGHAKKDAMVAAARQRYPELEVVDDNVADALAAGLVFLDKATFLEAV